MAQIINTQTGGGYGNIIAQIQALPPYYLKEVVENVSPADSGFGHDGGRCKVEYLLDAGTGPNNSISAMDLQLVVQQILGTTAYNPTDGRLMRIPPLAHPVYPFLYASSITNMKGESAPAVLTPCNPPLETPAIGQFALYPRYVITVEFTPRPYAVMQDASIELEKGITWYGWGNTQNSARFAHEYWRYTEVWSEPQADNITAKAGQMVFSAPGSKADKQIFGGMPKMFLPNSLMKVKWYQVPYRYVTSGNSWIRTALGQINQLPWYGHPAGSLLYLNYKPTIYSPPLPEYISWANGRATTTAKLCDIEFAFLYTWRFTPLKPPVNTGSYQGQTSYYDQNNWNFVVGGHNLLPWLQDRNCYYATTKADPTLKITAGTPSWYSFPFQLLFTDPDV